MKRCVSAAVLSLILVSPAVADDSVGEWVPASGSQTQTRTPFQWAVNTRTGEMRLCIIGDPQLKCFTEFDPDSVASGEPVEGPDELKLLSRFKYIGPAKPAED